MMPIMRIPVRRGGGRDIRTLMLCTALVGAPLVLASVSSSVHAAETGDLRQALEAERMNLAQQRQRLDEQTRQLQEQQRRLDALESALLATMRGTGAGAGAGAEGAPPSPPIASQRAGQPAGVETVGEAPTEERAPQIAVLGDQGGIITRAGQLTIEPSVEYAHADRNRVLFRGIEVVEAVLVGVFDINESRQDAVTAGLAVRYGLSSRLEVTARLPYVYRTDRSVLAPIPGSENPPGSGAGTRESLAEGDGIGDVEASVRYQLNRGRGGWPFLIGGLQVIAPTGSDPFDIERTAVGAPRDTATGSGFWGVSPSLTALMPSEPAVFFGTLGYTRNFGRNIDTRIGSSQLDYAKPGDSLSAALGFGVSLNERASFNLGYGHSWAFGTRTVSRVEQSGGPGQPPTLSAPISMTSRDLQIGRYMFGVSYRVGPTTTLNWAVEIGATDDATDVRTVLRVPFSM